MRDVQNSILQSWDTPDYQDIVTLRKQKIWDMCNTCCIVPLSFYDSLTMHNIMYELIAFWNQQLT